MRSDTPESRQSKRRSFEGLLPGDASLQRAVVELTRIEIAGPRTPRPLLHSLGRGGGGQLPRDFARIARDSTTSVGRPTATQSSISMVSYSSTWRRAA
jgi:hypothetical protein